ncbi:4-O-methyl-glucuronoyl methylesterase [Madurella mycetomatis]|uniref:(4-O-methyl)-D-glucuronate--lignin esterase n=1 Tax=Madurella mycetomatis TaxID=100816 RepID=A0A175VXC5_9PEZI|nr:4-O-methyl-glucuronoyl methylesterase [Madurella mycetomatis]
MLTRSITLFLLHTILGTTKAAPELIPTPTADETCTLSNNYPTVDETRLPDPWRFADGKVVATTGDFTCRQAEISKILQQYEFGDFPPAPDSVKATWANTTFVTSNTTTSGGTMTVTVEVNNRTNTFSVNVTHPSTRSSSTHGSPAIIAYGGWSIPVPADVGRIIFANDACAAQTGSGSRGNGWFFHLHGRSHSAGSLLAWAWCVGRVIDGLEVLGASTTGINPSRLGVTGCSRNAKGAMVAGAFDKRIILTIPQESGVGGVACWRMYENELRRSRQIEPGRRQRISELASSNTWFSARFNNFTTSIQKMPADHHFLPALVAPRGLFVVENNIDWLAPRSTTGCMKAGRAIYNGLGVKSNMGFALHGGHNHCLFPAESEPALLSFINHFLFGKGAPDDVEVTPVSINTADWMYRWAAAPNLSLSSP